MRSVMFAAVGLTAVLACGCKHAVPRYAMPIERPSPTEMEVRLFKAAGEGN